MTYDPRAPVAHVLPVDAPGYLSEQVPANASGLIALRRAPDAPWVFHTASAGDGYPGALVDGLILTAEPCTPHKGNATHPEQCLLAGDSDPGRLSRGLLTADGFAVTVPHPGWYKVGFFSPRACYKGTPELTKDFLYVPAGGAELNAFQVHGCGA